MTNERAPSFWLRALVAFGWATTFHLFAIALAGAWMLVPLYLFPDRWPDVVKWLAVAVTVVSGYLLLRSSVWVKDPFFPPSRALGPKDHEALQALVGEVASALGTSPPSEIFLLPDASASAVEVRRGLFLRRKRVLLLGIGLLNVCTVAQLRAAVAHELAHFIGGDALLAPVVARVRHGLLRIHDEIEGSVLSLPLRLYADTFLRMTQSISREQERWADKAASRIAGSHALAEVLRRQARADLLYNLLLRSGVHVLLAAGLRPRNLYDGVRRFEQAAARDGLTGTLEGLLDQRSASPYDSHPPLEERLAQLRQPESVNEDRHAPSDDDTRLARELLSEPEALEERVTTTLFDEGGQPPLVPVEWDDVASRAVRPALDEGARNAREHVARLFGPERARTDEAALRTLLEVLSRPTGSTSLNAAGAYDAIADTLRRALQPHVASLLSRTLLRRGGQLIVEVGRPFVILLEREAHDPNALAEDAVQDAAAAASLLNVLSRLPPVEVSKPQQRAPPKERDESDRHRKTEGEESATER